MGQWGCRTGRMSVSQRQAEVARCGWVVQEELSVQRLVTCHVCSPGPWQV